MTATHQQITDALRDELQQYGELLAQLEAQREIISQHEKQSAHGSIASIEAQSLNIETARLSREKLQSKLAWSLGQTDPVPLDQLIPLLPSDHQPLVEALALEINQLITRAQTQASLNQAQLERSLNLMKRSVHTLSSRATSAIRADEKTQSSTESLQGSFPAVIV